jgi:hypothetical protein
MATEMTMTWGGRSKRTSVVALGLVAILAGIAVAYFLTSEKFAGNTAIGGTLTVDTTLPLDFTSQALYPTDENNPSEDAVVEQLFTITNNNTVAVQYQMFATCEDCIPDPADTPAEAEARAERKDQFDHLMVEITSDPPRQCQAFPFNAAELIPNSPKCTAYVYKGHLAAMTAPVTLTTGGSTNANTVPAGEAHDWSVKLWLANVDAEQPQGIQNFWEFHINATTPVYVGGALSLGRHRRSSVPASTH